MPEYLPQALEWIRNCKLVVHVSLGCNMNLRQFHILDKIYPFFFLFFKFPTGSTLIRVRVFSIFILVKTDV